MLSSRPIKEDSLSIQQLKKYPSTRFMGSKSKLLEEIWDTTKDLSFSTVLDLFSGSGSVGYMYKCFGKEVTCNDYMAMAAVFSKAMIENSHVTLTIEEAEDLLQEKGRSDHFVGQTFSGLYFSDSENDIIDTLRGNISTIRDPYKHAIAMSALIRACMKKRPRGIFTYTGNRYDDGRQDLKKTLSMQFLEAVQTINGAVFDNGKQNKSSWNDALSLPAEHYDLVYFDPPYFTPKSDNEYVRRYHFVEGLARNWEGVELQENTKTKKFKSYSTPFSTALGAEAAFDSLFHKYKESILVVSYSSNSIPEKARMIELLKQYKHSVDVFPVDYKYSFGTTKNVMRNNVQEYIFIAQ